MDDKELDDLFQQYLKPPEPSLDEVILAKVDWIRGNPDVGSDHIKLRPGVTEEEVEDVLFSVPPQVEAKRHPAYPNSTIFRGQTPSGRRLFIVCYDRTEEGKRILTPITAFSPELGEKYWRQYE